MRMKEQPIHTQQEKKKTVIRKIEINQVQAQRITCLLGFATMVITGCGMFESVGVLPRKFDEISIQANTTTPIVLACTEKTIGKLAQQEKNWIPEVTKKDLSMGILETGNFEQTNVVGFRVKAEYNSERGLLKLDLKGSGLYHTDLGVADGMESLKRGIQDCV